MVCTSECRFLCYVFVRLLMREKRDDALVVVRCLVFLFSCYGGELDDMSCIVVW